jgi:hypothetical protein
MVRADPRPRRNIQPNRVWLLKLLGFHYSHWRGEYVLRVIGDRIGPVYRVAYGWRMVAGLEEMHDLKS